MCLKNQHKRTIRKIKNSVKRLMDATKYPYRRVIHPRRFQAYCLGTAKSGTHSIAGLFGQHYRVAHEPEGEFLAETVVLTEGQVNFYAQQKMILARDQRLWLELESSMLTYHYMEILLKTFPQAKFILTIRDCYSWLDSLINHQLGEWSSISWQMLRDAHYRQPDDVYAPAEQILHEHGLYTLDGYLSYWATHNQHVLDTIPADRLLVIPTKQITAYLPQLADFLSIPPTTLISDKSHLYKAKEKFGILTQIDHNFLEQKVNQHCRTLMDAYFPEMRNLHETIKE
ncbi:sulfotransferase [Anaerolineales bacterium HSG25]|nr:sulfotransferase [Anaerolineales bacterium HSG25]